MSKKIIDEYAEMMKAYEQSGGNIGEFSNPNVPSIVISGNKVLGKNEIKGLIIEPVPTKDGVDVKITVKKGLRFCILWHFALEFCLKKGFKL